MIMCSSQLSNLIMKNGWCYLKGMVLYLYNSLVGICGVWMVLSQFIGRDVEQRNHKDYVAGTFATSCFSSS